MIARPHRFHGHASVSAMYRRAQTVRGPLAGLKSAPREGRTRKYRVAVVVSRKVSKSAVVRNRIRRRIYEVVRRNAGSMTGPYDLVFTVYGDQLASLDAAALETLILGLLHKAHVLEVSQSPLPPRHGIVKRTRE